MFDMGLIGTLALAAGAMVLTGGNIAPPGRNKPVREAILLTAFGAAEPAALQVLRSFEQRIRDAFAGVEIRWAFTSPRIRAKQTELGEVWESPEIALARLMDDEYTHLAVLSLNIIPGIEFHELARNARLYAHMERGIQQLEMVRPLLSSHGDMMRVAAAWIGNLPPGRGPDDAVLLMGHGSPQHPADAIYLAMHQIFQDLDPNVFVGTMAGRPSLPDLLPKLTAKKIKRVYLAPFMAMAGGHAHRDMAGQEPTSWRSILEKHGYSCQVILKGMVEYPEIADIWIDHLRSVLDHFPSRGRT
jgi:sirohydrochlorin cobaltochelatase